MLKEKEPDLAREIKHWKASSFSDEQKLCEYIAFKLMDHNISEMGKIILPKWYERKSDIGNSNIYSSIRTQFRPYATARQTEFTPAQIEECLRFIAAAKGGRAKGEIYQPMITEKTRKFIELDKDLWALLFHVIYCNDRKADYPTIKKTKKDGAKLISKKTILTEPIDDKTKELQRLLAKIIVRRRLVDSSERECAEQVAKIRREKDQMKRSLADLAVNRSSLDAFRRKYSDTKRKP